MELHSLNNSQLIDLLAKYTSDYTRMLSEGQFDEEYERCKIAIKALQAEIELRKSPGNIHPDPTSDIASPPEIS